MKGEKCLIVFCLVVEIFIYGDCFDLIKVYGWCKNRVFWVIIIFDDSDVEESSLYVYYVEDGNKVVFIVFVGKFWLL